jgi:hypothetical protein
VLADVELLLELLRSLEGGRGVSISASSYSALINSPDVSRVFSRAQEYRFARDWEPEDKQMRGKAYPGEALLEAFEAHGESKAIVVMLWM